MKLYVILGFLILVELVSSLGLLGGDATRREGQPLMGGYSEQNLDLLTSEKKNYYINAANKAIEMMNDVTNGKPLIFQKLVSVRTQVRHLNLYY